MGQRSQIYIRYNVNYVYGSATDHPKTQNFKGLIARYFQWNYGERMISRARYIIEEIKDEFMEYKYCFNDNEKLEKLKRFCETNFDIVYIPIFGNKKLIRRIRKNDKWYKFYSLYEKYTEAVLKIRSIVSNIEQTGGFCPNTSNEDNTMKNIERSTEKAIKAWNRRASN